MTKPKWAMTELAIVRDMVATARNCPNLSSRRVAVMLATVLPGRSYDAIRAAWAREKRKVAHGTTN